MKTLYFIMAFLASPAWAGGDIFAQCQFDQECLEGESCNSTSFELTVRHSDAMAFELETIAESVPGIVFDNRHPDAASTLLAASATAHHLLTISPEGAARYTVHMQGPFAVTYLGSCEVAQ